jgi:hypothetical protein
MIRYLKAEPKNDYLRCDRGSSLPQEKALLGQLPDDGSLKRECRQLEPMYKALLEEAS